MRKPTTWWPSLSARQNEAFRNIWQALRQHGHVVSGAPNLGQWSERADSFAICAIRVPMTDEIGDTIGPLHEALHRFPFVHAYPADHLYISIQELGFVVDTPKLSDELSMDHIQEFIRHASIPISDFPAFNVTLGGFNSFLDTPFLDVHDDGWCYRIHHRLRDFVMAQPDDAFAYLPHVMLGYYVNSSDMESFPAQMARWRDRTYGSFVAPSVDILKLSTHDPDATPAVVHSFELGHTRGAADTISSSPAGDMF